MNQAQFFSFWGLLLAVTVFGASLGFGVAAGNFGLRGVLFVAVLGTFAGASAKSAFMTRRATP